MNVSLVMFKADGSRRDFPVTKPRIVVGRTNDCDLRIPLSSVSRQHCEFRLDGDQFKLHDLGSSNGTFRNNTRIAQETLLSAGDEVVIGPVVFTVVVDGKPETIDPVRTVLERNKAAAAHADDSNASAVQPQRVAFDTGVDMPSVEPEEAYTPTVDLDDGDEDDDPIAALAALAAGANDSAPPPETPEAPEDTDALAMEDPEVPEVPEAPEVPDVTEDTAALAMEAPDAVEDLEPFDASNFELNNEIELPDAAQPDSALAAEVAASISDDSGVFVPPEAESDEMAPLMPLEADDLDDDIIPVLEEDDEDLPLLAEDDDEHNKR